MSVTAVSAVRLDLLDLPTPCSEWRLRNLLAHMTVQNVGFAAAVDGVAADWALGELGADPVADYVAASDRVIAAFAQEDALERLLDLPEVSRSQLIPGSLAIRFHLVDSVVHAWDVARSLGEEIELDPALGDAAYRIAAKVPDGESRLAPNAAFAPSVSSADKSSQLDRIVALLGRSPSWSSEVAVSRRVSG
jgi:uncharacterized protein (TIGR03086 family)